MQVYIYKYIYIYKNRNLTGNWQENTCGTQTGAGRSQPRSIWLPAHPTELNWHPKRKVTLNVAWLLGSDRRVWVFPKLLGLSCTTIPRVNRWSENREKNPVSSCSLGQDALLMPEVRGERPGWFQLIEMQHQQEIYASVLTLWWRYVVTTKPSETLLRAHNLTCTSLEL